MRNSWTGEPIVLQFPVSENLALAVHRREEGAFERFVAAYERSLFNYADRILGNHHDAQEVVQDTFIRAHDALTRQYDAPRIDELAVKPWLFRITRNLCFNKRRGKKGRLDEPLSTFDDGRIGPLVPAHSVTRGIEESQERAALERALATLPPESRELIVLRFMEEMSYAEISKTIGLEEAALRGRVFRSLKMLRDALSTSEVAHAV